jgi:hypothetical protein
MGYPFGKSFCYILVVCSFVNFFVSSGARQEPLHDFTAKYYHTSSIPEPGGLCLSSTKHEDNSGSTGQ